MKDLLVSEWVTKVKPDVNIVERLIHIRVIRGIQWMMCWWVLLHFVPSPKYKTSSLGHGQCYTHTHTPTHTHTHKQCQVDTSNKSVDEDYWKKEIVDTCPS